MEKWFSFILILTIAVLFVFETPFANPAEVCRVALTEKAYDRERSKIRSNIMFSARDELCNREYNNIGEAQSAARSRGFSLGYSGLSIGASDARQSNNNKWNISDTKFCRATSTELQTSYASDYENQIASVAVQAWLECVKSSNENLLYLDYKISEDGQRFTGTLHTTASTGALARKITGIAVVGDAASSTTCNIAGKKYNPADVAAKPIEVKTTGTTVACEKSSDKSVSIAFQTSVAGVPFIDLPTKKELRATEIKVLKADLASLRNKVAPLERKLAELKAAIAHADAARIGGDNDSIQAIRNLGVEYQCHLSGTGDVPGRRNWAICGTRGEDKQMEAIWIKLIGKPE